MGMEGILAGVALGTVGLVIVGSSMRYYNDCTDYENCFWQSKKVETQKVEEVAQSNLPRVNYYDQALENGKAAATAAATAKTEEEWQNVAGLWGDAISNLNRILPGGPNESVIEQKKKDYQAAQQAAVQQKNKASAKQGEQQTSTSSSGKSPEYLLAAIDRDPQLEPTYASLLNRLEPKCTEDRMKIANMTVKSVELLADEGVRSNNLEMLNGLDDSIPQLEFEMNCAEIYAALVTLMTN